MCLLSFLHSIFYISVNIEAKVIVRSRRNGKSRPTSDGPFLSRFLPALVCVLRFGRLLCELLSYALDSRLNVAHLRVVGKFQNHCANPRQRRDVVGVLTIDALAIVSGDANGFQIALYRFSCRDVHAA
jgi:hypothetical protein